MKVKQISIFLENKSGRLAEVTKVLGEGKINIRALSIADTSDFGILRLIVDTPGEAFKLLKEHDFTVSQTDVIAVEVSDNPGGLAAALAALEGNNINIEYMYAFLEKSSQDALVVFRVENIPRTIEILKNEKFNILSAEEVYEL
jgi:hypothetical protein